MTNAALIMMLVTMGIITVGTVYFLVKALKSPKRPEPDSFTENDDDNE
jgi:hypothetical protein